MPYTSEELELLFEIQSISTNTGMPVVIAIFRHFSDCIDPKLKKSELEAPELEFIDKLMKDERLSEAGYGDKMIDRTLENLKVNGFFDIELKKIKPTNKGIKVLKLLGFIKDEEV